MRTYYNRIRLAGLFLFAAMLCSLRSRTQTGFDSGLFQKKLDAWIPNVNETTPGYVLGVISKGKVIFTNTKGCADLETGTPINPHTLFNTGSVSKQFTAFLILNLEREGKLNLDDRASNFLQDYPVLINYPITLRHLLHHTSGLRELQELLEIADGQDKYGYRSENIDDILRIQQHTNFPPGERYQYSNTNYFLLARVIEKASGVDYPRYCREKIFAPLGMTSAFVMDDFKKVVLQKAKAYIQRNGRFETDTPMDQFYGANGIYLSLQDLLTWTANLMSRKANNDLLFAKFTSSGTLKGAPFFYGYGFNVGDYKGNELLEHNGAKLGYRAEVFYLPQKEFAIVALANYRSFPITNLYRIADELLGIESKTNLQLPLPPKPVISKQQHDVSLYTGLYWSPESDLVRKIYQRNDTLLFFRSPGNESRLIPGGNDLFYMMLGDSLTWNRIQFRAHRKNRYQMIFISDRGDSIFFKAVDTVNAAKNKISELEGVYYCSEIDATFKLLPSGSALTVKLKGWPSLQLQAAFKDYYVNPAVGSFYIQRNQQGKVISVVYDSPRTRHLEYRKIHLKIEH